MQYYIWAAVFIGSFLVSCGASKRSEEIEGQRRQGLDIIFESLDAYSGGPSLSSKGDRLAFISGRGGSLQAFKAETPIGESSFSPTRVHQESTQDLEVWLTPDGAGLFLRQAGSTS